MLCYLLTRRTLEGGIGRRSRLKICRRSPGMGVQLPPPAPFTVYYSPFGLSACIFNDIPTLNV